MQKNYKSINGFYYFRCLKMHILLTIQRQKTSVVIAITNHFNLIFK